MVDDETIEGGDLFFTSTSSDIASLPRPFVAAGRSVRLQSNPVPRVLVLGYGLGSMAAVMLKLNPACQIDGVEHDPDLYDRATARTPSQVDLHLGDAARYIRQTRRRYDLILDDCFGFAANDAVRVPRVPATDLAARLADTGVVVRNLLVDSEHPLRPQASDLAEHFEHFATRTFREWDNVLVIASRAPLDGDLVRRL